MGEGLGDHGREVTGQANMYAPSASTRPAGTDEGSECFSAVSSQGTSWITGSGNHNKFIYYLQLASSRVVPVGAANIPRSWGALACSYFGQPTA